LAVAFAGADKYAKEANGDIDENDSWSDLDATNVVFGDDGLDDDDEDDDWSSPCSSEKHEDPSTS
jgi:hypothetical protein